LYLTGKSGGVFHMLRFFTVDWGFPYW